MTLSILESSRSEDFIRTYADNKPALLWYKVICDTQTPLAIYAKLKAGEKYSYLLESVQGGENRGRYTIMGCHPDLLWRTHKNAVEINNNPSQNTYLPQSGTPKENLKKLLADSQIDHPQSLPLLSSLVVGYLGYDCINWQEDIPSQNISTLETPDSFMMRPQIILVCDTITNTLSIICVCHPKGDSAQQALLKARQKLDNTLVRLEGSIPKDTFKHEQVNKEDLNFSSDIAEMKTNISAEDFQKNVLKAKEYIKAGDIFQVVLSQRFSMPFPLPPLALFRELRRSNPSPYLFFLDCGDFSITGSSPELMVRLREGTVTIRPIAGTRKRGENVAEDKALENELLNDEKECAEHLMLLDLGRNDVSRVSEIGSVSVTDSFTVERYSHVMHIVSNVEGQLKTGYDRIDALMAGFPAGTVSGAPKIRAMEIIDELETVQRGIYAGCVGYFDGNNNMDNCIALRTAIIHQGMLHVQAGAGVVADSDPKAEHQECLHKAKAIHSAACTAIDQARLIRQI